MQQHHCNSSHNITATINSNNDKNTNKQNDYEQEAIKNHRKKMEIQVKH